MHSEWRQRQRNGATASASEAPAEISTPVRSPNRCVCQACAESRAREEKLAKDEAHVPHEPPGAQHRRNAASTERAASDAQAARGRPQRSAENATSSMKMPGGTERAASARTDARTTGSTWRDAEEGSSERHPG